MGVWDQKLQLQLNSLDGVVVGWKIGVLDVFATWYYLLKIIKVGFNDCELRTNIYYLEVCIMDVIILDADFLNKCFIVLYTLLS